MKYIASTLLCFGLAFQAQAATPNKSLKVIPHNILKEDGALQGGASGRVTSLLDIRRSYSKDKKNERVVIDVGDANQQKLQGRLGYYTVEMKKGRQIVLNFNQTLNSRFDEKELKKRLTGSGYIQSSKLLFDPMSQTMSLVMDLKKTAAVKVVAVGGSKETGKLVLDFTENKIK